MLRRSSVIDSEFWSVFLIF